MLCSPSIGCTRGQTLGLTLLHVALLHSIAIEKSQTEQVATSETQQQSINSRLIGNKFPLKKFCKPSTNAIHTREPINVILSTAEIEHGLLYDTPIQLPRRDPKPPALYEGGRWYCSLEAWVSASRLVRSQLWRARHICSALYTATHARVGVPRLCRLHCPATIECPLGARGFG